MYQITKQVKLKESGLKSESPATPKYSLFEYLYIFIYVYCTWLIGDPLVPPDHLDMQKLKSFITKTAVSNKW